MPKLKIVRDSLLLAYDEKLLSDDAFLLLYDLNKSRNPEYNYLDYEKFDLDNISEDDCYAEFRLKKRRYS